MGDTILVTAMVLSVMPMGEQDKRVLLLTRELGKVSAFARGARRQNSPLQASTRPFTYGAYYLYPGRSAYTLQSVQVKEYFTGLSSDMEGVAYGCYFMELAEHFSVENMDGTEMLKLLYLSLKALENPNLSKPLVRLIFEWRLFLIQGEYPQVFTCQHCREQITQGVFSLGAGGLLCPSCHAGIKDGVPMSEAACYTLQYIFSAPLNKLYTFVLNPQVEAEVQRALDQWKGRFLDRNFKSLGVLALMTDNLKSHERKST